MINLIVAPYCYNCPEFEAHVKKESYQLQEFDMSETIIENHTIVTCEHRERCQGMKNWLAKQQKEDKDD